MKYPVKKLLIITEDKEPEFYGDPSIYSSHIEYLRDYVIDTYPQNDIIQKWKRSGSPNEIAGALALFKNTIIVMNDVDVRNERYLSTCIISVPEVMSEELKNGFEEMIPFFENFNTLIAVKQKVVRDNDGILRLQDESIDINTKDSIEEQINTIIKETSNSKRKVK